MSETKSVLVPLDHIHPNPDNPRHEAGDVTELAASLRQQGFKQLMLVRPAPEFGDDHYMVMDGYRRWVAARTVFTHAYVNVEETHPDESLVVREIMTSLTTDIHRKDLNIIERARAYGRLRDEAGMTQTQIGRMLGIDATTISRDMSLLELSPRYQESVRTGKTKVEHALAAVKRSRAIQRVAKGQKPASVEWEPEHFTKDHPLAKKAKTMCDARGHSNRRRYGGQACGNCWETVIRQDENLTVRVEYKGLGFDVPFIPPIMTPDNERNGADR